MITLDILIQENQQSLDALQKKLGYTFKDPRHLQRALIHSSFSFEQGETFAKDNETLEFLGDAVLDLTVGFALFKCFPDMTEGELTKLRAALVNESHLFLMADEVGLGEHLFLGKGEEQSKGRQKTSILANTYEAVVGAIFLDTGYDAVAQFVESHFVPWFDKRKKNLLFADSKSALQEAFQEKYGEAPAYFLEREEGPDHDKRFFVTVRFRDKVLASGSAGSKKEAEQKAAADALRNRDSFL